MSQSIDRMEHTSRKRVLTEDRRRQNRESQRRFRERRKTRCNPKQALASEEASLTQNQVHEHATVSLVELDLRNTWNEMSPWSELAVQPTPSTSTTLALYSTEESNTVRHPDMSPSGSTGMLSAESQDLVPPLPSPYRNFLQIHELNFYAARIQNALYLGVPLQLARKNESISPWYWHAQFAALYSGPSGPSPLALSGASLPSHDGNSSPDIFTRPVRRRPCFELPKDAMEDLAPTALQLSHPHEMYLDMIPFPLFRDRVITMLSMTPPAFDAYELKRDIDAQGLRVWGVAQGARDRAGTLVRDRRNWECSKWFSKKWKLLVNGTGLDDQSLWWRTLRGDDDEEEE